jgi:hypothetical protein
MNQIRRAQSRSNSGVRAAVSGNGTEENEFASPDGKTHASEAFRTNQLEPNWALCGTDGTAGTDSGEDLAAQQLALHSQHVRVCPACEGCAITATCSHKSSRLKLVAASRFMTSM